MEDMTVDHGVETDSSLTTVSKSNSEAFARLLRVYGRPGQVVVDPTYGNGVFWRDIDLTAYTVLKSDIRDGVDLRKLPYQDDSADVVVIDPPYRYTPVKNKRHEDTPGHGVVDGLYNLKASGLTNTAAVIDLYRGGIVESHRVLKIGGFLFLKCQDTVQDGKQIWVHCELKTIAEQNGYAMRDLLVVETTSPTKTRWERQRHLRKSHSYFLVFRKGGHFPFGMPSVCRR